MQLRMKTLVIPLALIAAGSSAVEGKHSWLMAQNQDLTQAQKDDRCESIRRVLMGDDATGKNSGLRYERSQAEAKVAQLQKDLDAAQQQTTSLTAIDKHINDDLRGINGPWAVAPPDKQTVALARRDLDYWTAQKEKQLVGLQITRTRDKYPPFLQQALAQEQQRLSELNSAIANENDIADSLNCQAYWASHPVTSPSTPAPSNPGTNAGSGAGPLERIKVITSYQCFETDKDAKGGLPGATITFTPASGDSPISAVADSGGVGRVSMPAGTYTVKLPKSKTQVPQFGDAKVLWVRIHILGTPGQGNTFQATSDEGDISVKFALVGDPNALDDYEVALRVASISQCSY